MAPRALSHSRRQRALALPPRPPHGRPRVSSPLTCEIVFDDKEEKTNSTYISIEPSNRISITEDEHASRPRASYIIVCLLIDCLLSFCLCQMALDTLLNLHHNVASIPPAFKADGRVMLCLPTHNADPRFVALADYPVLPVEKRLSEITDLPANCNFLPNMLVKVSQLASPSSFIPLLVTCFITLKLAFALLLLRTSSNPKAPFFYLRNAVLSHLLITYTALVFLKLHFKLFLRHYPAVDKVLTTSSEFMFFILGFFVCLCILSLCVMPLLWIFSSNSEPRGHYHEVYSMSQSSFPTSITGPSRPEGRNSFMVMSEKGSTAISKQKKNPGPSSF